MTDRECLRGDAAAGVGADASGQETETSRRTALKLAGLATVGGTALAGAVTSGTAGASGGDQSDDGATQVARLTAPDGQAGDRFGQAVDAADECQRVIVGAAGQLSEQRTGAAYVYSMVDGAWTLTETLAPDEDAAAFGAAVALDADGRTAVVGAPETDVGEGYTGRAYVFERGSDGWTRVATFGANEVEFAESYGDGESVRRFGGAVELDADGDTVLVGAPLSNRPAAPTSGAAYAFVADGGEWTQTSEILYPGGDSTTGGAAVALDADGSQCVTGMPNAFPGRTGHVLVSDTDDGGIPEIELTASGDPELNLLGTCVTTDSDGELIVAGAPGSTPDDPRAGRFYTFAQQDGQWSETAELLPEDGHVEDSCGQATALDAAGERLLAGAPAHDAEVGDDAGAVHVFANGEAWQQTDTLAPADGGQAGAEFGAACALGDAGTAAFVGAQREDTDDGEDAGAVYVFDFETTDGDDGQGGEENDGDEQGGEQNDGENGADDGEEGNDENQGDDGNGEEDDGDDGNDDSDDGGNDGDDESDDSDGGDEDENSDDDGDASDEGDVEIAVQPAAPDDPINPRSREDLPVAILQSDGFDPTDDASGVDVSTVRVGTPDVVGGASLVGSASKRAPTADGASPTHDGHVEDVDDDGDDDLLVHVPTRDVGLEGREATLKLVAETHDGREVVGTATVDVLHCGL